MSAVMSCLSRSSSLLTAARAANAPARQSECYAVHTECDTAHKLLPPSAQAATLQADCRNTRAQRMETRDDKPTPRLSCPQNKPSDTVGPRGTHLPLPRPAAVLLPLPPLPPLLRAAAAAAAAAAWRLLLLLGTAGQLSLMALLLLLLSGLREGQALGAGLAAVSVWRWGVKVPGCGCCDAAGAAPCMQHSTAWRDTLCAMGISSTVSSVQAIAVSPAQP